MSIEKVQSDVRRLLRKRQLQELIPVANGTLYSWMDKNSPYFDASFPLPIRLGGGRSIFWIAAEVDEWLKTWADKSRASAKATKGV
nr:AlpA family phage regulatory protein [uncultured Roseateles sp.]